MVEIRLLEKKDWQGLYDLVETVDKELVGMYSETEELVEDWVNTIMKGLWEVYVAILPQEEIQKEQKRFVRKIFPWKYLEDNPSGIVGLVTLYGDYEEDEEIEKGEFDIGISVAEPFQRRGIGREMMEFVIKRGRELNYEKATLWTRVDNQPMIVLAERFGFEKGRGKLRGGYRWIKYSLKL